ncbi:GNAT family N-acetyltransferase [Chlorobium sp. BLA1]|uniref:GNAT family N-acetyltransferase n=1 Tax=Candidatus Chlorobium masyuteum TaxID=2716876 RepID=UPI00141FA8B6|nr:GNAT family N-acetyltransferase [Candidatus Chlorobium masyuteum]NHQ59243.1 GNAT family N-acetyltransferase [Candidatus Chlorobium masyuteum]
MSDYPLEVHTERFLLRTLTVDDVNERYAGWLRDSLTSEYITAKLDLADLKAYVLELSRRRDVIFLGVFDKNTGLHIGNIKYEPVDPEQGYAIMGILIGECDWRGKGVAAEVLNATADWLQKYHNIKQIILGVSRSHTAAITAYQKVGFVEESTPFIPIVLPENMVMVWHLNPYI